MLDVCYDVMSYDMGQWLELKLAMCQTLRMQRAVELEALLMARTQCQTEFIAMIKIGVSSKAKCYTERLLLWSARKCCSSIETLVSSNASPGECVTERTTEPNTAQTERVVVRLAVTPHLCGSRLYQAKRLLPMSSMYRLCLILCCLARVARSTLRRHSTRTSRMVAELMVAPR